MPDSLSQSIARNVIYLRKERGVSQEQLSTICCIPRTTLSNIESGASNPTIKILSQVAKGLRVSVEELIASPNPTCHFFKSRELAKKKRAQGSAFVFNLLPKPIPGIQLERIELVREAVMIGVPHSKGTKEYFTCIEGLISVTVDGQAYEIEKDDVLVFPGDCKHGYRNRLTTPSSGISVVVLE